MILEQNDMAATSDGNLEQSGIFRSSSTIIMRLELSDAERFKKKLKRVSTVQSAFDTASVAQQLRRTILSRGPWDPSDLECRR